MIQFKELKVKNFLQFGNNETILNLENFKTTLITGSNGAGKSSLIVEGLTFALFGKPYRDIKKGQLVNFINDKNSVVELQFQIQNDEYKIVRGQKPNILKLFKNDEEIPESQSSKDFQEFIETEILRMNIVSFKQLVVLGTANFIPFMQLTTPQRRKLIDDLLDVSIFTQMDQLNKGSLKELSQKMSENQIRLTSLKSELNAYELLLKEQQSKMFNSDELIEQEIIEKQLKAKTIKAEIDQIKEQILQLTELIKQDDQLEVYKKLEQAEFLLTNKIQQISQRINETKNKDFCISCNQQINEETRVDVIKKLTSEMTSEQNKVDLARQKIKSLKESLDLYNERQSKLTKHNVDLTTLNTQFQILLSDIKKLQEQKQSIKNEFDTTKIDDLKNQIDELEKSQQDMFNEKYLRTVLSTLLVDSGIKSTVIKKFIPIMNKKINQYLKILGADYFFMLDEDFNEQIKGSCREKQSYYSFSQGEKARVDLALMFTWRDIASMVSGTEINVLVLDEVFDSSTDSSGVTGIRQVLDSIKSNVFIISHREQNSDDYNRHIEVKKQGRFSQLEVTIND